MPETNPVNLSPIPSGQSAQQHVAELVLDISQKVAKADNLICNCRSLWKRSPG